MAEIGGSLPSQKNEFPTVQCVCGKRKQRGFICDFCYSTDALGTSNDSQ